MWSSAVVFLCLSFGRLKSPVGDLGDARIEVIDEDGVHRVARVRPAGRQTPTGAPQAPHGLGIGRVNVVGSRTSVGTSPTPPHSR